MTAELKNIVIIGAATAGMNLVQSLLPKLASSHRIVLIEANPVGYWSIGALRASVLPGFEEKVVHDLSSTTVFGDSNTRHVVLAGTRVVDIQPEYVVVDRDVSSLLPGAQVDGGKSKIRVDKAVLAIGADYGFPARISPGTTSKEQVLQGFRTMQRDIESAQEILVVGGGPTGVEFVGEVLDVHPSKVVTLITRGPGLITNGKDSFGGLSAKLVSQLQAKGVRLIFNDSLSTSSLEGISTGPLSPAKTFTSEKGEQITADFILLSSGGKPNTCWLSHSHPELVDSKTSLIKVNPTFDLSTPGWERYFAIGDAANTPGAKTSFMAKTHAPTLASNILASIKGEGEGKMNKASGPPGEVMAVPLGKNGGASYLMMGSVGGWLTGLVKGKGLFVGQFEGWYKA